MNDNQAQVQKVSEQTALSAPANAGADETDIRWGLTTNLALVRRRLFSLALMATLPPLLAAFSGHATLLAGLGSWLTGWLTMTTLYYLIGVFPRYSMHIDEKGITYSPSYAKILLNRLHRSWGDIRVVDYEPLVADLKIEYRSGGYASILLQAQSKQQHRLLLSRLEAYVEASKFTGAAVQLKEAILGRKALPPSYTDLWQSELASRHSTSHFVPLPATYQLDSPSLGKLNVLTELGAGGFSAIYLVEDRNGAQFVLKEAVLTLDMKEEQKDKLRQLFHREAKILTTLKHPNIVNVHDYFTYNDRDYVVLDYVHGQTLRQLVCASGAMNVPAVTKIGLQIAHIVAFVHEHSPPVIHRDLTPDNLMCQESGEVMLIDFGAASEFIGLATGTTIGKKCYIPPEQMRGKAEPRSDLYAFGCTLYFLATGCDPVALSCSKLPAEVTIDLKASALSTIIAKCTCLDVADRYINMNAVIDDLKNATAAPTPR